MARRSTRGAVPLPVNTPFPTGGYSPVNGLTGASAVPPGAVANYGTGTITTPPPPTTGTTNAAPTINDPLVRYIIDQHNKNYGEARAGNIAREGKIETGYDTLGNQAQTLGTAVVGNAQAGYGAASQGGLERYNTNMDKYNKWASDQTKAGADFNAQFMDNLNKTNASINERNDAIQRKIRQDYEQRQDKIMRDFEGLGEKEQEDIRQQWRDQSANQQQELQSRGLGGTTVMPTMQAGILRQSNRDVGLLQEKLRHEKIGTEAELSGQTLGQQGQYNESQADRIARQNEQGFSLGAGLGESQLGRTQQLGLTGFDAANRFNTQKTAQDIGNNQFIAGLQTGNNAQTIGIGQNKLNFLNSISEPYPSMAGMEGILKSYGAAGGGAYGGGAVLGSPGSPAAVGGLGGLSGWAGGGGGGAVFGPPRPQGTPMIREPDYSSTGPYGPGLNEPGGRRYKVRPMTAQETKTHARNPNELNNPDTGTTVVYQ